MIRKTKQQITSYFVETPQNESLRMCAFDESVPQNTLRTLVSRLFDTLCLAAFFQFAACCFPASVSAASDETRYKGMLFTNAYVALDANEATRRVWQNLYGADLQIEQVWRELYSGHLDLNFAHVPTAVDRQFQSRSELRLREGYVRYADEGLELRLGRHVTPWGKSDVINPTDTLSTRDSARFSPRDEDLRLGSDGLLMTWTPSQGSSAWTWTGVWNFHFEDSGLLLAPGGLPENTSLQISPAPAASLENSEFALKSSYFTPEWDGSVSYFEGWDRSPELIFRSYDPLTAHLSLKTQHERVHVIGADYSRAFSQYVFRAETAYSAPTEQDQVTPQHRPAHADGVIGVERPFGEKWRVQFQVLARYFPRLANPDAVIGTTPLEVAFNQSLGRANARLRSYEDRWRVGETLRVSWGDADTDWNPEIFFLHYGASHELFVRPMLVHRLRPALKATVGADIFSGPTGSAFRQQEVFNSAFVELAYQF